MNVQYYVDNAVQKVVGTVEGFIDDIGVLRVDIRQEYEKAEYLSEIFELAAANF